MTITYMPMVGGMHSTGVEPVTLGSEDRCSIQLSYECGGNYFTLAGGCWPVVGQGAVEFRSRGLFGGDTDEESVRHGCEDKDTETAHECGVKEAGQIEACIGSINGRATTAMTGRRNVAMEGRMQAAGFAMSARP